MPKIASIGAQLHSAPKPNVRIAWLQGVTLAWMVVELGVSGYAAAAARSPAMLAFSSDSFVELLSALLVLLQWVPKLKISERKTAWIAAALLFCLAVVVAVTASATFVLRLRPETSLAGVSITLAALVVMPVLAWLKRRDARRLGNAALAADAVQSATCAYLALIALIGVAVNAIFHLWWFDSAAGLLSVPLLVKEGRSAWRGHTCTCC